MAKISLRHFSDFRNHVSLFADVKQSIFIIFKPVRAVGKLLPFIIVTENANIFGILISDLFIFIL